MFALDDLDRKIAACLQADGRSSWTAIAERCDISLATVSRRGQRLLANDIVRVAVVPTTNHAGASSMFLLRLACRAGAQGDVAAALADHTHIRFLALVSGRHDLVAEISVNTADSVVNQLVTEVQNVDGVDWCESDLIMHEHKVALDWSWQLLTGEHRVLPSGEPHECEAGHLDETDRRIVDVMRADGRAAFSAVAAGTGLDETTVRRRFEALLQRGCIRVITLVPASAFGFSSEVILDVSVEPARLGAVSRELATIAGVRFVAYTLNGSSLLCEVIQPSTQALHEFLTGTLATLKGVRGWEANMELLTVRRGFVQTPWWRGEFADAFGSRPTVAHGEARRRRGRTRPAAV